MDINYRHFIGISLPVAASCCIFNVAAAIQLCGDRDYVYDYLKRDSTAIPVGGAFFTGLILRAFAWLHFVCSYSKSAGDRTKFRLFIFGDYKLVASVIRVLMILLAYDVIRGYINSCYKFCLFDFLFQLTAITAIIFYSRPIPDYISRFRSSRLKTSI